MSISATVSLVLFDSSFGDVESDNYDIYSLSLNPW